jgi:hypothetical protein
VEQSGAKYQICICIDMYMFHLTLVVGAAYQIWSLTDLGITYRTIGEIETARQKVGSKSNDLT